MKSQGRNTFALKEKAIPVEAPDAADQVKIAQGQADNNDFRPSHEDEFSGSLHIQIPKSLHRQLSESAKREGISLNEYIIYKLAR